MQLPSSGPPREPDLGTDAGAGAGAGASADAVRAAYAERAGAGADAVRAAYAERAGEYATALGSMSTVHPDDLDLVTRWAGGLDGPVLDLGCGPGHWTAFLAGRGGLDVSGADPVPAFVEHARRTHPGVRYEVGTAEHLAADDGSLGGVLAWYSLIHHHPDALAEPLSEIARVLRPGGRLLVGSFEAPTLETFDHAVVTAWRWPVAELAARLEAAGLAVLETTTRTDPGSRPHAALIAERRTAR